MRNDAWQFDTTFNNTEQQTLDNAKWHMYMSRFLTLHYKTILQLIDIRNFALPRVDPKIQRLNFNEKILSKATTDMKSNGNFFLILFFFS